MFVNMTNSLADKFKSDEGGFQSHPILSLDSAKHQLWSDLSIYMDDTDAQRS